MDGVPRHELAMGSLTAGIDAVSFLADSGIFPSKGEARKTIQGGGVSINREKLSDVTAVIGKEHLLNGRYILVQKGKKNFYLVVVQG